MDNNKLPVGAVQGNHMNNYGKYRRQVNLNNDFEAQASNPDLPLPVYKPKTLQASKEEAAPLPIEPVELIEEDQPEIEGQEQLPLPPKFEAAPTMVADPIKQEPVLSPLGEEEKSIEDDAINLLSLPLKAAARLKEGIQEANTTGNLLAIPNSLTDSAEEALVESSAFFHDYAVEPVFDAVFSKVEGEYRQQNPDVEEKGKWGRRLDFIFKPFEAVGAAITAPFTETVDEQGFTKTQNLYNQLRDNDVEITPELMKQLAQAKDTEQLLNWLSSGVEKSKEAVKEKLDFEYGSESKSYGEAVMNTHFPEASDGVKLGGGLVLDVITGAPIASTAVGGVAVGKLAQMSLRKAKMIPQDSTYRGILSEGVNDLADIIRNSVNSEANPEMLTDIGKLAKAADTGDVKAMEALNSELTKIPEVVAELKRIDKAVVKSGITKVDNAFGSAKDPLVQMAEEGSTASTKFNLSKINDDEDLTELVDTFKQRATKDLVLARNDPKKQADMLKAAQVSIQQIAGKQAKDFSPEETIAYKQAIEVAAQQVSAKAKAASGVVPSPLDVAAYEKSLGVFNSLLEKATDIKQTRSHLNDLYRVTAQNDVARIRQAQGIMSEVVSQSPSSRALRKALAQSDDIDDIAKMAATSVTLKESMPKLYYKVLINSYISSPATFSANMVSNTATAVMQPTLSTFAGLTAAARGRLGDASIHMKDAGAQLSGIVEGTSDILKMVSKQKDWDSLGLPNEMKQAHEISRQKINYNNTKERLEQEGLWGVTTDALDKLVKAPGESLLIADRGFKTVSYRAMINKEASRIANSTPGTAADKKQIYNTLKNHPTEAMISKGVDYAAEVTFTKDLGKIGSKAQQLIQEIPGATPFFLFFKVGTNMMKSGVRNGPIGNVAIDLKEFAIKEGPESDVAAARIALGTAIPAALVASVGDKFVGSLDHTDPHDAELIRRGVPEYSLETVDEFGNTEYVKFGHLEPIRAIIGMSVNYRDAINSIEEVDPETGEENPLLVEYAKAFTKPFINTITENYLMDNVGSVMSTIEYAKEGNVPKLEALAERLTVDVAVPNFFKSINEQYFDNVARISETFGERAMSRIPGLSTKLPEEVTSWGDTKIRPRTVGKKFLSPIVTLDKDLDKWDNLIIDLGVDLKDPPKYIDGPQNLKVYLTEAQQAELGRLRGKGIPDLNGVQAPIKELMIEAMTNPEWDTLAPRERRQGLQNLWDARTSQVKQYMLTTNEELQFQMQRKTELLEMQTLKGRNDPNSLGSLR